MKKEQVKLNIIFLIYPIAALALMATQAGLGITPQFKNLMGKTISAAVLVLACLSIHLLQGSFHQLINLLTVATAFYFIGNVLPNWGSGAPAFRNPANTADLPAADVAIITARFLLVSLALFVGLYLFFSFAGSDIVFLPTAKNAYSRIVKTEMMIM